LRGGSFTGDFEGKVNYYGVVVKKALETGVTLHRGPVGEPGGSVYWEF